MHPPRCFRAVSGLSFARTSAALDAGSRDPRTLQQRVAAWAGDYRYCTLRLPQTKQPIVVVGDRGSRIVRRSLHEEFRAKESGLTMVTVIPNGATSACRDSIQPSRPNVDAA
jgi:hypothetical protein